MKTQRPVEPGTRCEATFGSANGKIGVIIKYLRTNEEGHDHKVAGHVYKVKFEGMSRTKDYHEKFLKHLSEPKFYAGDEVVCTFHDKKYNGKEGVVIGFKGMNVTWENECYMVHFHSGLKSSIADTFLKLK